MNNIYMKERYNQIEKLWCLAYDEASFHHTFQTINFSLFLQPILSSPYYPVFQREMLSELKDSNQWNQRCWEVIQFFQYINFAFSSQLLETNMDFIPETNLRRTFGTFRLWIDLERLYLFFFLKIDRIEFQEDRIFMTLMRTLMFLKAFFTIHKPKDFFDNYLEKVSAQIQRRMDAVKHVLPKYMLPIATDIGNIIKNFIIDQTLVPIGNEEEYKKTMYQKLIKQIESIQQLQRRLENNVNYLQKNQNQFTIKRIVCHSFLKELTEEVVPLFDSKSVMIEKYKARSLQTGQEFNEQKIREDFISHQQKMKQKQINVTTEDILLQVGHNPYEQTKFAIYGADLGIDMSKRDKNLKKKQEKAIEQDTNFITDMYYQNDFIEKAMSLNMNYGKIQIEDLNDKYLPDSIDHDLKGYHRKANTSGKLSNLKWTKTQNQKFTMDTGHSHKIYQENELKDLQNNVLFRYQQENEELEKMQQKKVLNLIIANEEINEKKKKLFLKSKALQRLDQKIEQFYKNAPNNERLSLKNNSTVNRHKFDSLRKVVNLAAIEKKLYNLIHKKNVPPFLPRNIDQIRGYQSNTEKKVDKIKAALSHIKDHSRKNR